MTRWLSAGGELLATGLFVLAVAFVVAAGTPLGTAVLPPLLASLTDGRVTVDGVAGTLLTGVRAERIEARLGTVAIDLDDVSLRVAWPALLGGEVRLRRAAVDRLAIRVTPDPAAPDEPVAPLRLPVVIAATDLRVGTLEIGVGDAPPTLLDDLRLTGRLREGDLGIDALALRYAGIALAAGGRLGTGEPFDLDARVTLDWPEAGLAGTARLAGSLADLRLDGVLVAPEPIDVAATARLLGPEPAVDLRVEAARVARDLPDGRNLVVAGLTLAVSGWVDALEASTAARVAVAGYPALRIAARARGDTTRLSLPEVTVDALGGRLAGQGAVTLQPAVAAELRFTGKDLDPGDLEPRFAGSLALAGQVRVTAEGDFSLDLTRAAGEFLDRPFAAAGRVARSGEDWRFTGIEVAAGANRLTLDGRLGRALAATFRIEAPELATLWPGLDGRLAGRGAVGGSLARPRLDVDLDGADLRYGDVAVGALSVRGGIAQRERVGLSVAVRDIAAGDYALGDFTATARGPLADFDLAAELAGGDAGFALAADGRLEGNRLELDLDAGELRLPGDLRWTLAGPATVRLADGAAAVTDHCWTSDPARLCIAGARYAADGFAAEATLRDLELGRFASLLPPGLGLEGALAVDVAARSTAGQLTGRLRVAPSAVALSWRVDDDGDELRTELTAALLEVAATGDRVSYRALLADTLGLRLAAEGRIDAPFAAEPLIEGSLRGGVDDLARLSGLADRFADLGGLAGSLRIDTTLSGRLRAPLVTGGIELADAAFTVPAAGVTIDRINVSLAGAEPGRATVRGSARSGKGFVQLGGELAWDERFLPTARLQVRGRLFDVIDIPAAFVQVSPNVNVVLVDGQFRASGEVLVPRAQIRPQRIDAGAVAPSPDAIVHGRDEQRRGVRGRPLFILDGLRVRLGKDVRFDGLGLKSDVKGAITLYQNLPEDPYAVTADGVLELDNGQFTALGQVLNIERGSLRFAGLVTDPGIDAKASREVIYEGRTVTAGVVLSGLLSRIETRVYSEPSMGEMDALSYLTTGKPLADASMGDRFSVANAALTLGMRGALPIAQQIGDAIRVDELGVEGAGGENTAVFVGERFGEDLYVRYSYGIFDQVGTIRVTYRIGRRFSIEGSSGRAQALDLIYSIIW